MPRLLQDAARLFACHAHPRPASQQKVIPACARVFGSPQTRSAHIVHSQPERFEQFTVGVSRRDLLVNGLVLSVATSQPAAMGQSGKPDAGWYTVPAVEQPRTIAITGANSGIGFAAAGKLAAAGHNVYLICRTMEKAEKACTDVQEKYGPLKGTVHAEQCELGNLASIREFAKSWIASGRPIDTLCLNAGAQFSGEKEPRRTQDGFELTVGANHLGHFLLANLLLPAVESSKLGPRIVVTASEVHDPLSAGGKIGVGATLGDLKGLAAGPNFEMVSGDPFDADKAYKDSKLCNVLFARELARRLKEQGSAVSVTAFGPGLITRTGFFRNAPPLFIRIFDFATNNLLGVAETVQGGGDCLAKLSQDPALDGVSGAYFNNQTTGTPLFSPGHEFRQKDPSQEAQNEAEARLLWDLSSKLVALGA